MRGVKIKGKKIDTLFVVVFAEIMRTRMTVYEKVQAINKLYEIVNDSLSARMFK